jgi:hypothetical protein
MPGEVEKSKTFEVTFLLVRSMMNKSRYGYIQVPDTRDVGQPRSRSERRRESRC